MGGTERTPHPSQDPRHGDTFTLFPGRVDTQFNFDPTQLKSYQTPVHTAM